MPDVLLDFCAWIVTHQKDILINIVAGVIAATVLLVSQTGVVLVASLLHDLVTRRLMLRRLFGFARSVEPIHVLSGSLDQKQSLLQGPDARAAAQIHLTIEQIFRRRRVLDEFSVDKLNHDVPHADYCSVGGPEFNACTRNTLIHLRNFVYFDEAGCLHVPANGRKFECAMAGTRVMKDYGVLVRVRNPMDHERTAIVVAGCDTYGVYAAAQLLTSSRRFKGLYRSFRKKRGWKNSLLNQDFLAVVSCIPMGNEISNVQIEVVEPIFEDPDTLKSVVCAENSEGEPTKP